MIYTKPAKTHCCGFLPARRHEHDPRWSGGRLGSIARNVRSPARKSLGRRLLVILDRNKLMGRSRGVGLIANFNLHKYPRDPATGVLHYRRNSYGSEPLKRARSVCVAERLYHRIPLARLSCYSVTAAMAAHFPARTTHPANAEITRRAEYI